MTLYDVNIDRRNSRSVAVGNVVIGGGNPIVVQSMTNTDTADIESTVGQVIALADAGSELVRITVNTEDAAKAGIHTSDLTDRAVRTLEGRGLERALATLIFHPIGLRVFDYGSLEGTANGWALESGTVLNFEVFYRDPDVGGIHVEDSIVISQTGNSRLGALDRALYVF